jgi:DNA-binding MarR family transcriptional regulator
MSTIVTTLKNNANKSGSSKKRSNITFNTWRLLDSARFAVGRLRDMELACSGLTPEQVAILNSLKIRNGKALVTEIANVWMRQRNSITTLVHRMEKLGLVKNNKYPGQKEIEIEITLKGENLLSKIPRESLERAFSPLSEKEMLELTVFLSKLLLNARNQLGYDDELPPQLRL